MASPRSNRSRHNSTSPSRMSSSTGAGASSRSICSGVRTIDSRTAPRRNEAASPKKGTAAPMAKRKAPTGGARHFVEDGLGGDQRPVGRFQTSGAGGASIGIAACEAVSTKTSPSPSRKAAA